MSYISQTSKLDLHTSRFVTNAFFKILIKMTFWYCFDPNVIRGHAFTWPSLFFSHCLLALGTLICEPPALGILIWESDYKQNQNKKNNNNNKQSMTDPLASKWCRRVMCYFEFLFTKLYLFKTSLIISIIYVGNHVYVLNNPNHQKLYTKITMIVLLVAELLM